MKPENTDTPLKADCPSANCSARSFDAGVSLIEAMGVISRAVPILCKTCQWSENQNGVWDTACDKTFFFDADGPVENGAKFCLYCGGELIPVPYPHNAELTHPEPKP